ncbi:hypothetical protein LJR013_004093 [Pseudarthrobacter oxydans]|uniref:hypothetical protein n=1 Tax=Pseudarthrobacter oxydans TaxID=1671 RepID=UPI003ED07B1E
MDLSTARGIKNELLARFAEQEAARGGNGLRSDVIGTGSFAVGVAVSPERNDDFGVSIRFPGTRVRNAAILEDFRKTLGVELDVRVVGDIQAIRQGQPAPAHLPLNRQRPLMPGSSVGHRLVSAGTLGCFVGVDGLERPAILSNNHVLAASDRGSSGDPILQPGVLDGGGHPADHVARLSGFVRLSEQGSLYDVAVAEVLEDGLVGSNDFPDGPLAGLTDEPENGLVEKWGRTTGHTRGRVTAIELDGLDIGYDGRIIRFNGAIEIESLDSAPFGAPGDSGSVIYSSSSREGYGLLFAGSTSGGKGGAPLTYANPLGGALSAVNARLI